MNEITRDAMYTLMDVYLATPAASPEPIRLAASEHIAVSRPYAVVAAEYKASLEHPVPDPALQQQLAEELQPLRVALSILDGRYPGMGLIVTTGD
jgi:hypothetical protein